MKYAVVMMAKNEADIIGLSIRRWVHLGASKIYLCDNASTDQTVEFAAHNSKGAMIDITHDHATTFDGERIINGLINRALDDGLNWIFPADADEFLTGPTDDIPGYLRSLRQRPSYSEIPYFNVWPSGKVTMQTPQKKVFGYFDRQMRVSIGNHQIIGRASRFDSPLKYNHYQFRSYTQTRKKIIEHGKAFTEMGIHDNRYAVAYRRYLAEGECFFDHVWKNITNTIEPLW